MSIVREVKIKTHYTVKCVFIFSGLSIYSPEIHHFRRRHKFPFCADMLFVPFGID